MELGIRIGLASSSDREDIDLCLEAAGLAGYFPVRASGDEVAEGKPAPDVYLLACRRLGVEPTGCIAIEDSHHGKAAALAAGLEVVWVTEIRDEPEPGVRKTKTLAGIGEGDWKAMLGSTTDLRVP
jgi:beta-phosphoglucomutase-like phosphatase (HAD superfamily)